MRLGFLQRLLLLPLLGGAFAQDGNEHDPFDVSWATHSDKLTYNQGFYDSYMEKCRAATAQSPTLCDMTEKDRMVRNRNQPRGMNNFTELGFAVVQTPPDLFKRMQRYFHQHKDAHQDIEWKQVSHSYQNAWDSPSTMIPLSKHDPVLQNDIYEATESILQEWTGQRLAPSAFWGIRVYHNNSVLATHVDYPPRIISVIINVYQDVDEPWPLEMWGHDGNAYNITLQPGEMALYESHSIIHGRPFPFKGTMFANIFVHFEPLGPADKPLTDYLKEPLGEYPPYLNTEDPESMALWKRIAPRGWSLYRSDLVFYITYGMLDSVEDLVIQKPSLFSSRTKEGFLPIELAIKAGHDDIVDLLIQMKAYGDLTEEDVLVKLKAARDESSDIVKKAKKHFGAEEL